MRSTAAQYLRRTFLRLAGATVIAVPAADRVFADNRDIQREETPMDIRGHVPPDPDQLKDDMVASAT
jgi:hypothetical protein